MLPLNKTNAGRVVKIKEIMRIKDFPQKYIFKAIEKIEISKDGDIYALESDHLYEFNAKGEFVRDFYRKGEGPGEFNQSLGGFVLGDDEVTMFSSSMNKIVRLSTTGKIIQELRPKSLFLYVLSRFKDRFYCVTNEFGNYRKMTGIHDNNLKLGMLDDSGRITFTPYVFPFSLSIYVRARGISVIYVSQFLHTKKELKSVFISVTPDYLVTLWDFEKNTILNFRRKYERVRYISDKDSRAAMPPMPKFMNDISAIQTYDDKLWVLTSTCDKNKGLLTDVFDYEGRYLDAFYLPLLWLTAFREMTGMHTYRVVTAMRENFLFIAETDEEGLISIAKYKVILE